MNHFTQTSPSNNNNNNNNLINSNIIINNTTSSTTSSLDPLDMVKIYLNEIYSLNKKIETLTQKTQQTIPSNNNNNNHPSVTNTQTNLDIDELQTMITNLKEQNAILRSQSDYPELISYYELKLEENQSKNINNIHIFTKCIQRLMKNSNLNDRDDTWRRLLKTYENKICDLETKISQYEKQERKMKSRQIFFEKYCYKAEAKYEKIAKMTKRFEQQFAERKQFYKDLEKVENDITKQKEENEKYKEQVYVLKKFNSNAINALTVKDIEGSNGEWDMIRKNNEVNLKKLVDVEQKNHLNGNGNNSYESLILVLDNIQEFICTLLQNNNELISLDSVSGIISEAKNYTLMLFDRINIMKINLCVFVNEVCEMYGKLKGNENVDEVMKKIKGLCEKIVMEFKD